MAKLIDLIVSGKSSFANDISAKNIYADNFIRNGSSNNYVLLGGGGHKALSDFSMSHSHPYLPLAGGAMNQGSHVVFPGTSTDTNYGGSIEFREVNYVTTSQTDWSYAPGITFHWGGRTVGKLGLRSDGNLAWRDQSIIHSGNIGSQSVSYATSAGNAETVDSLHASAFMRAVDNGSGYYGIQHPDGGTSSWTRTTSNGIIPYTSGGSSSLGTSSWPFSTVYANNFYGYLNGNISGNADTVDGYHFSDLENRYVNVTGDTMTGNLSFSNGGTEFRGINYGTMGDNDQWRIGGAATGSNSGYMEIATADDGTEPIYVRQYTGVFSSLTRTLALLDGSGNTTIPGNVGIGTDGPSQRLDVIGNINIGNGGSETHIYARTSNFNNPALSFYDDTSGYGTMAVLGGGGCTVVGGGESAHEFAPNVRDENLYLTADQNVNIFTNLDGGYGSRRHVAHFNTNGDTYLYGNLYLGANASNNFIAFYGNTGDHPGSYVTTFIGEHLWGSPESTELLLMKFNDVGNGTDATTAYSSGPDRIRHLAHGHVFQIMTNTAQGDFATMANSTAVETKFDIARYQLHAYAPLAIISDGTNSGYDALVYMRHYSNNDWGLIVDKSQSYTYGVDIRAGGEYALRVGNGNTRLIGATIIGADATPSYTLDVRGTTRSTGKIYANEWIQFDNYTGLYSPNNNAHFYPNNTTSYGQWQLRGTRNGYSGIHFGDSTHYMTIMDNYSDKGVYQQDWGWLWYYNARNGKLSFRTSSDLGADNNFSGSVRTNSTYYGYGLYHLSYGSSAYALTSDGGATNIGSMSVYSAGVLRNEASIGAGDTHAQALKTYFNNNYSSIKRDTLNTYYSSAYWNGSFYMGYFLSGYDSNPYGGFFVAHYDTPYYVGISYGSFNQQQIITSSTIGSQSVNYANSAGSAGYSQKLQVHDVRSEVRTPNYFDGYKITSWFNNTGTPNGDWYSGIHVKGWHDGYTSWELCSYSSTGTANDYDLYFRSGNNTTWGSWKTIITSGNIGSQSVNYSNSAGQLSTTRYIYGNAFNGTQNVNGNLTLSTGDQINFQDPNNDGVAFNYDNNKSSPSSIRIYNGRYSEIARFTTSGYFGIGTASPRSSLHISGSTGVTIEGTGGGPYLTVNYNSRYDSDNSLDNYGINLIKFGKSSMDNYLGTGLNTGNSAYFGRQSYVFHTGSSYAFGWYSSGWTCLMELQGATGNLWTKGWVYSNYLHSRSNLYVQGTSYFGRDFYGDTYYINGPNYTGTSAYAKALASQGIVTAISGTSRYSSGLRFGRVYASGYPFSYGNTITIEDSFGTEIIFNCLGGGGATGSGEMKFRTHSDWESSEWGNWRTVIDSDNIGSQSVNYASSAGSVAWGNVTGKPSAYTPSSHTHSYLPLSGGTCTGNIYAPAFYESSDERLKDFYNSIDVDLDKLSSLPKKFFKWKSNPNGEFEIGTSAQELQKIYPQLVNTDDKGYLTVAYDKLSIIALRAIDKLYEMNKNLERRVQILESKH